MPFFVIPVKTGIQSFEDLLLLSLNIELRCSTFNVRPLFFFSFFYSDIAESLDNSASLGYIQ
ncbi:MAG: hypothetical protein C4576_30705 [Desulfobacteraceae bacterium]|nr:MAG: hypothetical protein C4576_30705 [Desulfobacteraceae bacterium]